jgi:hypothetical protein
VAAANATVAIAASSVVQNSIQAPRKACSSLRAAPRTTQARLLDSTLFALPVGIRNPDSITQRRGRIRG